MKFQISDDQSEILTECITRHNAANQTIQEALKYHSAIMSDNQRVSDEMWRQLELEHELDMSLDWMFTTIAGVPYVVSQQRAMTTNADNKT